MVDEHLLWVEPPAVAAAFGYGLNKDGSFTVAIPVMKHVLVPQGIKYNAWKKVHEYRMENLKRNVDIIPHLGIFRVIGADDDIMKFLYGRLDGNKKLLGKHKKSKKRKGLYHS